MGAYDKERLENLICFFAQQYYKNKKRYISQTELYKYIAFFEFRILENTGKPPLKLQYQAMNNGPVPKELYHNRNNMKSDLFEFINIQNNEYKIKSVKTPNLDFFSENEENEMKVIIDIFKNKEINSYHTSEASHEKIRAWRIAYYNIAPNSQINLDDTFEFKDKNNLTSQEDAYLLYKSIMALCK